MERHLVDFFWGIGIGSLFGAGLTLLISAWMIYHKKMRGE